MNSHVFIAYQHFAINYFLLLFFFKGKNFSLALVFFFFFGVTVNGLFVLEGE